jgi:hypothetical protein
VAGLVALLSLVVALLSLGGDAEDDVAAGSSTTSSSTSTSTTETTLELVPVAPSSTAAPTTAAPTTTGPPPPAVDGDGAVLQSPVGATKRTMTGSDCRSLAEGGAGWTAECGQVAARGGVDLVWLIERRSSPAGFRARVLRAAGGAAWQVVLAADDVSGSRFSAVKAAVADVSGDGRLDIGFGFRAAGASGNLAVDLVEGPGQVVVHQSLAKGSARLSSGQLNSWANDPTGSDQYRKQVIRLVGDTWRITASSREQGPPPASQL